MKNVYGIQMYSIRDITKSDLRLGLRLVSEMGYKEVEFAGFFGNSADEVASWLKEYGLATVGTHTGIEAISPENIKATISYHKAIGAKYLTVPGAKWSSEEDMRANIDAFNYADPILRSEGIILGYHNHSSEFYTTPYGKKVFDEIIARTDILLEVDTFWLYNAGIDPVPYLDLHKDRIKLIHLKDGKVDKSVEKSFSSPHVGAVGAPVGDGELPIKQIVDWAVNNGVKIVVESEDLTPTGPLEVERCLKNLIELEG